jgi:signal transduction histidine kinase
LLRRFTAGQWTEAQGRNIVEVLAAPLLMESARANLEQLRRGEGWSGEFFVQRRDGTTFTAHVSASLIQSERRTLISIVGISRDGTEQQQLKEANRLLAEAGALLIDALDYEASLTTLAQHIAVQLAATPEALTLQIHDDGRGIQAGEIAGLHSLDLLGMQERAKRLGGTFDIHGVPGDGTIVTVSIPVKPSE